MRGSKQPVRDCPRPAGRGLGDIGATGGRSAWRRSGVVFLLALAALALLAGGSTAAPRAVLVLRPELAAEAVFGPGSPIAPLLPRAALGVMNTAVRGPRRPESAYLTLGAGERVAAGPLAGRAPALSLPHWAEFRRAVDPDFPLGGPRAAGGLGQALSARGGAAWVGAGAATRTRLGALVAVDAAGTVARATVLDLAALSTRPGDPVRPDLPLSLPDAPLVVLDVPPAFDLRRLAALLAALTRDPERDVLLVSPYPAPGAGGAWDRLPPILGFGPHFPPGRLTSATTRTPGLVANIDVAPSVLGALNAPVPATMSGHRMRVEGPGDAAALLRFARAATAAQRAIVPLGMGIGAAAIGALVLSLVAFWGRHSPAPGTKPRSGSGRRIIGAATLARFALLAAAAAPLALLLAPLTEPGTVTGLIAGVAGWTVTLSVGGWASGRISRIPRIGRIRPTQSPTPNPQPPEPSPLLCLYALTVALVAGDLLLGGTLVARSPLSGFAVAGIRFYGVGNEYAGVLVGMGIMAPLLFEERLTRLRWAQAGYFLVLVLLIGSPGFGANLGGPPAAAAGFVTTLLLAGRPRRPLPAILAVAGAVLAVVAAVFLWDALQPAPLRSHIGEFAHAVRTGGWAVALPVLRRKEAMNLRLLTSAYALIPIAVVVPLLLLWYRRDRIRLQALLAGRPELRAAVGGSVVAAWSALVLKDSGVMPWTFITASMLALLLDEQLRAGQSGRCISRRGTGRNPEADPGEGPPRRLGDDSA